MREEERETHEMVHIINLSRAESFGLHNSNQYSIFTCTYTTRTAHAHVQYMYMMSDEVIPAPLSEAEETGGRPHSLLPLV